MPKTIRSVVVEPLDKRAMFAAAPVASVAPLAAAPAQRRVYLTGNSLTDGISYGGLVDLLKKDGAKVTYGRQTGTGYSQYDNLSLKSGLFTGGLDPARPGNGNPWGNYQKAFAAAQWDVLTIQPHDRRVVSDPKSSPTPHDEGEIPTGMQWLKVMARNNAKGQVFVYSRPARRTDVEGDGRTPTGQTFDYAAEWSKVYDDKAPSNLPYFSQSRTTQIMSRLRKAQRADATTAKLPEVKLIPVGEAYANVDKMIKAGKFSSTPIKSMLDLYRDQSHPTADVAAYVIALTFYSSITGHSPLGVAPPSAYTGSGSKILGTTTQRLLQQAVYDAVTAKVYAGFTTTLGGSVGTLPPPAGPGNLRGYIVNDTNANGVWDRTETGIARRSVWLDLDADGKYDANEPTRRTNANGVFQFNNVAVGTYSVRAFLNDGVRQTFPIRNRAITATVVSDTTVKIGTFLVV